MGQTRLDLAAGVEIQTLETALKGTLKNPNIFEASIMAVKVPSWAGGSAQNVQNCSHSSSAGRGSFCSHKVTKRVETMNIHAG